MKRCKLVEEYEKNLRKYLRFKHGISKKSHQDRQNRVKKFLRFCCQRGIETIKNIHKNDYDKFVQLYLSQFSTETKRKYLLALREFFTRARLPIKVSVQKSIQNTKEKRFERLLEICDCECLREYKDEILKLL